MTFIDIVLHHTGMNAAAVRISEPTERALKRDRVRLDAYRDRFSRIRSRLDGGSPWRPDAA